MSSGPEKTRCVAEKADVMVQMRMEVSRISALRWRKVGELSAGSDWLLLQISQDRIVAASVQTPKKIWAYTEVHRDAVEVQSQVHAPALRLASSIGITGTLSRAHVSAGSESFMPYYTSLAAK